MERHRGLEWKVGLFVLVALGLLSIMIFAVRGYRTFTPGYTIHVQLHAAGGIIPGAPVQFAGVKVGEVRTVTIARDASEALPRITLSIWLPQNLVIRSDDRAEIGMLGLLGEKYLEIAPGAGQGAIVKAGGQLIAEEPFFELDVMREAQQTLQHLDRLLERTDALLAPEGPLARLSASLETLDQLSRQLDETARQARSLMRPWQEVGERMSALLTEFERYIGLLVAGLIFALIVFRPVP